MKEIMNNAPAQDAGGKTEIYPGMTVEEIRAMYFDSDALREPPYRIFQLNGDGHRYYYRFNADGDPEFYPSVTTLLRQVTPTSPQLIEWMVKNGDSAAEKRDLAAAYGTFMHAQFERLIINRSYDFDAVPTALRAFMEQENLPEKFYHENLSKVRKDVLAFAQFVVDWNVKPLAVEIGLVHPLHRFAGCVDLPCVMTEPKKNGKTFTAIVDFKSGRKGFYEEHELQLHLYRDMWNVNFPECPVDRVFNFSPKDWRKSPTYNLKDQTESKNAKKLPHLLALSAIEDEKRENSMTVISGIVNLDAYDIDANLRTLSLAEFIRTKNEQLDAPAEEPSEASLFDGQATEKEAE